MGVRRAWEGWDRPTGLFRLAAYVTAQCGNLGSGRSYGFGCLGMPTYINPSQPWFTPESQSRGQTHPISSVASLPISTLPDTFPSFFSTMAIKRKLDFDEEPVNIFTDVCARRPPFRLRCSHDIFLASRQTCPCPDKSRRAPLQL